MVSADSEPRKRKLDPVRKRDYYTERTQYALGVFVALDECVFTGGVCQAFQGAAFLLGLEYL